MIFFKTGNTGKQLTLIIGQKSPINRYLIVIKTNHFLNIVLDVMTIENSKTPKFPNNRKETPGSTGG